MTSLLHSDIVLILPIKIWCQIQLLGHPFKTCILDTVNFVGIVISLRHIAMHTEDSEFDSLLDACFVKYTFNILL